MARSIRITLESGERLEEYREQGEIEATEGRILTRLHRTRERNPTLVKKKKAQALKKYGRLTCEVCEFDFAATYGEHGTGFIECHHTTPLYALEPGSKTKLGDLALLCANCHRMVHARRPWLTMNELRAVIR